MAPAQPPPPPLWLKKPPSTRVPTAEELRTEWAERIKLLADCVTCRQQLAKLDADVANTQAHLNSAHFPHLPDESKQRIQAELAQLQTKQKELAKRRDDALALLTKLNAWPASPLSEAEEKELQKYNDMVAYVDSLEKTANEMNALFNDLRERKSLEDATPIHLDTQDENASRPLKRRRVLDPTTPETTPGPTMAELEDMREKLSDLEGRYVTFENDMHAHDAEAREEAEEALNSQLEQFAQSLVDAPAPDAYKEVKDNIDNTGKEVEELATEVGELVLQADAQRKEMELVKRRIEASNAELAQMQQQFQSYTEGREKDHQAIVALEAALNAYVDEPPSASSHPGLTHDQLVELMEEPLLDMVRANIKPLIEQLRVQVQEMLQSQNQEMYKTLWGKLTLTLHMVETIAERIRQIDGASGPP